VSGAPYSARAWTPPSKTGEHLRDQASAPVLGVIGFDPEARMRPLIVQADPHSGHAEAFRQLRTNRWKATSAVFGSRTTWASRGPLA